jgi:membrane protease YdiL (CAAX protease family)
VTAFQLIAILLIILWFMLVVVQYRRSSVVLIGGLSGIGLYTLAALAFRKVTLDALGLGFSHAWLSTFGFSLAGLGVMLAYSPLADWLARRWFVKPPTLEAFGVIKQSKAKLIAGIVVAWILGGVLEELIARGIFLQSVQAALTPWLIKPVAVGVALGYAALGAGVMHLYQGPRALVITTQLSILFGILFVVSGYNLWAVMICHGLYDTIAFIRFATGKSRYSDLKVDQPPSSETSK